MVKTTFKQKRFNSVYMASDFYLSIWTCWNTELQRVQVNQCQFCVHVKAEENLALPSFQVVCSCSLFSTCLFCFIDCLMIFSPTRHECVIVFIKCPCPISPCFILSRLDMLKWKAFLIKPTVCSILMIDVTIDERN